MKQPKSLTPSRARVLLPRLHRKKLQWPDISEEEALFIRHLNESLTWSELASYLVGVSNVNIGMLLAQAAERKVGDRLPVVKLSNRLTKVSSGLEEESLSA
jgi:hypothetical protein